MQLAEAFLRSGKVRDLFQLPDHRMILVASDRISAFDVVLPSLIPDKGRVLTGISRFWFAETGGIIRNHLLATDPGLISEAIAARGVSTDEIGSVEALRGRVMICSPAQVLPVEAVVRGYLAGSGWKEYRESGTVCGIPLPRGLSESDRLPEPIFTPATKAPIGEHDENVSFDGMIDHLDTASWDFGGMGIRSELAALAERVRDVSLQLYRYGAAVAERNGVILADTKFEFGIGGGDPTLAEPAGPAEERLPASDPGSGGGGYSWSGRLEDIMLIDEVLTPDSSRFWDASTYAPGTSQASFDKQYVRDWLETLDWDKTAPGPELPEEVVAGTRMRYVEAFERITGASFQRYLDADVIGAGA